MAKVRRFEDLRVWQDAMDLAKGVHAACREGGLRRDEVLRTQIWRSAVSVPSNIAEGFERFSRAEFTRFLLISRASCGELRCQLTLARNVDLLPASTADRLLDQAASVARQLSALLARLRKSPSPRSAQP